jgi:hypothetical protein
MTNNPDFLNALDACIEAVSAGQSVDQAVAKYPQYAAQLRAMLAAGLSVRRMGPDAAEIAVAQERVRFRIQAELSRSKPVPFFMRTAVVLLVISVLTVGSGGLYLLSRGNDDTDPTPTLPASMPNITKSPTSTATLTGTPSPTLTTTRTSTGTATYTTTSTATNTATHLSLIHI